MKISQKQTFMSQTNKIRVKNVFRSKCPSWNEMPKLERFLKKVTVPTWAQVLLVEPALASKKQCSRRSDIERTSNA